jgi:hypothetical protein
LLCYSHVMLFLILIHSFWYVRWFRNISSRYFYEKTCLWHFQVLLLFFMSSLWIDLAILNLFWKSFQSWNIVLTASSSAVIWFNSILLIDSMDLDINEKGHSLLKFYFNIFKYCCFFISFHCFWFVLWFWITSLRYFQNKILFSHFKVLLLFAFDLFCNSEYFLNDISVL